MFADCSKVRGIVCLSLVTVFSQTQMPSVAQTTPTEGPRDIVTRWIELHRTGETDEAAALTTGSIDHQAVHQLPSGRDTGVRVARSLGSDHVAAVVTTALDDREKSASVLLFWLVHRDGDWRIRKSGVVPRGVADERLRGFLEAEGVRWWVSSEVLLGHWESGPCRLAGFTGIACGSRLELRPEDHFGLESWGPAGPPPNGDDDLGVEGSWQLTDNGLVLTHQNRDHAYRIVWMAEDLLVIESLDREGRVTYHRSEPDVRTDAREGVGARKGADATQ